MRSELGQRCDALKRRLFGVDITTFDRAGLLALLQESMDSGSRLAVSWLNPFYVQKAVGDPGLRDLMNSFDVLQPDGWGVVWAARLAGIGVDERLAIEDIERELFGAMAARGQSVYLFGSAPGTAESAAARLTATFPGLRIAGTDHGWYDAMAGHPGRYSKQDNDRIVDRITRRGSGPAARGVAHAAAAAVVDREPGAAELPLLMTMGAYFDHLAEGLDWYPRWMDRWHLDWLYRLAREPRRLAYRYTIGMARYGLLVAREVVRARLRRAR